MNSSLRDAINGIGDVWSYKWTDQTTDTYLRALADLEEADALAAITHVIGTWENTQKPPPGVIRAHADVLRRQRNAAERQDALDKEHGLGKYRQ